MADPRRCTCGHTELEHLLNTQGCFVLGCDCDKFELLPTRTQHALNIRTILDTDTGSARVLFAFEDVSLQFVPDAAMQIALNIIAAVYAARGEQALYQYAKAHDLDIKELLGLVRQSGV